MKSQIAAPIASSRQLTQAEQNALASAANLLVDIEDLLMDLTSPIMPESQLSARIRVMAARSLLTEIRQLGPILSRLAGTSPVLVGRIEDEYGSDDGGVLR